MVCKLVVRRVAALTALVVGLAACGTDPEPGTSAAGSSTSAAGGAGAATSSSSSSADATSSASSGGGATGGQGGGAGAGGVPEVECEPTDAMPELLADTSHPGGGIALTPTHVYWLEPKMNATLQPIGELRRVPRCGGDFQDLALNQAAPTDMVAIGTSVYWTNGGTVQSGDLVDSSVRRINVASSIDVLAPMESGAGPISADADFVYWANGGYGGINGKAVSGGSTFSIADVQAESLAVDDDAIYWLESAGGLARAPKTKDAAVTELAPGECDEGMSWGGVALDSTTAYWVDQCGTVRRVAKTGGAADVLASGQTAPAPFGAHRIAVDDQHVYWLTADSVMRVPIGGGSEPIAIAPSGQSAIGYAGSIALGGQDVFWSAKLGVWRLTKP